MVAALHEDVRLQLVGDAQPERRAGIAVGVSELGLDQRVVVVTATGDIPAYLTDGVDAYLVPPGHALRFAEHRFDYRRHGRRLNAFIRSL